MIINNSPLGFSKSDENCTDCREDNFMLPVALVDNPQFQVNSSCTEITGGGLKSDCESNQIGPYTEDFQRYQGDTLQDMIPEYLISTEDINFTEFQSGGNIFSTEVGFLPANRCFWLRYTITGYLSGFIQTIADAGETKRTTGPNPAREANGTYTELYCTDSDGRLRFQIGNDDTPEELNTFILSNIFIGCIRYSELYDLLGDEVDIALVTYGSQTSICKPVTANSVIAELREVPFMPGQVYKICFTIAGSTQGQVDLLFNSTTPLAFPGNGRHCVELTYEDITYNTKLDFEMTAAFNGCIQDIEVFLVPEFRIAAFDMEGNEVEDILNIDQVGNALKLSFQTSAAGNCYRIGISDNCSNYRNQFYGNILDAEGYYSEPISNEDFGPWGKIFKGEFNAWAFTPLGWAESSGGEFTNYFIIRDSICYNKLYDAVFNLTIDDNGNPIGQIEVCVELAGSSYCQTINTPGASETITFTDILSAISEAQANIDLFCPNDYCSLVGPNYLTVLISLKSVVKNNANAPLIEFTTGTDSTLTMDVEPGQFCPEYFSVPLAVSIAAPCDTVLVKYRNSQNAFDFDYSSSEFSEEQGFYNSLRIPGKLWNPTYPREIQIQKNSTGFRTNYYADVDKTYLLSAGRLTEFIHDALALAIVHDYVNIDGKELVCSSEEYSPEWNKDTTSATVELEFYLQQSRKLNTKC